MLPVTDNAESLKGLHLKIYEILCELLAGSSELRNGHFLSVQLVLLDNSALNGHTVVVPAGNKGYLEAAHGLVFVDKVLEHLVENVSHVDVTVGKGRAVVKHEKRLTLILLQRLSVQIDLLPIVIYTRLTLRQVSTHCKFCARQIKTILVICWHLLYSSSKKILLFNNDNVRRSVRRIYPQRDGSCPFSFYRKYFLLYIYRVP